MEKTYFIGNDNGDRGWVQYTDGERNEAGELKIIDEVMGGEFFLSQDEVNRSMYQIEEFKYRMIVDLYDVVNETGSEKYMDAINKLIEAFIEEIEAE